MNRARFQKFIDRDVTAFDSGAGSDTLVPQHRIRRGMGGSKILDRPSNIITFTSLNNGAIEQDAYYAAYAKKMGWTFESWYDPLDVPAFSWHRGWVMLDDNFNWTPASGDRITWWSGESIR